MNNKFPKLAKSDELKKNLNTMFFAYLKSDDADDRQERQEVVVLYQALIDWL